NYILKDPISLHNVGCADNKGIYEVKDVGSLTSFIEVARKGYLNPELDKYDELLNLDVECNPVIFYYERK
ncbi:MAG: hypothetical protein LIO65_08180, partial [Odoribacter sp.]|nr:hypothetical protein [Odoribacter sp.]